MGWFNVGKENREEKVYLAISENNRDNQQSYGIAFFDQQFNPNNDFEFVVSVL